MEKNAISNRRFWLKWRIRDRFIQAAIRIRTFWSWRRMIWRVKMELWRWKRRAQKRFEIKLDARQVCKRTLAQREICASSSKLESNKTLISNISLCKCLAPKMKLKFLKFLLFRASISVTRWFSRGDWTKMNKRRSCRSLKTFFMVSKKRFVQTDQRDCFRLNLSSNHFAVEMGCHEKKTDVVFLLSQNFVIEVFSNYFQFVSTF